MLASYEAARAAAVELALPRPSPVPRLLSPWLERPPGPRRRRKPTGGGALRGFRSRRPPWGIDGARPRQAPPTAGRPTFAGPTSTSRPASTAATAALQDLARAHQLTLNTVVQGAYCPAAGPLAAAVDDVIYGASRPPAVPPQLDGRRVDGGDVHQHPADPRPGRRRTRCSCPGSRTCKPSRLELRRHEWSPLVQVQGQSDVPRGRPLFESIFVFENYPVDASLAGHAGRLGIEEAPLPRAGRTIPLTVMVFPGAEIRLRVGFDTRRFDADAIDRMLGHLRTALEGFAADPARRLADLPILSAGRSSDRPAPRYGARHSADLGGRPPTGFSDEEIALLARPVFLIEGDRGEDHSMSNTLKKTADLSVDEKRALLARLLREKGGPARAKEAGAHRLVEAQAANTPDAVAVRFDGKDAHLRRGSTPGPTGSRIT